MPLLTPREANASSLQAEAEDNRAAYLATAQNITNKIEDRKAVVDSRLAALEAERTSLDSIVV